MHTNILYGNVLFVHANQLLSKQKISGTQHHSKQMCGTASFVNTSSPKTLVQQAEAGGRNEKNLHKRSAGIRSVASNEPFFGTDTRWEPVINMFYWTRHLLLTKIRSAYIFWFSC